MGDRYHLQQFAGQTVSQEGTQETDERNARKKLLFNMIRKTRSQSTNSALPRRRPGRPKATSKTLEFGLRLMKGTDEDGSRVTETVACPLGDSNKLKLKCDLDMNYEVLLTKIQHAFFPRGKNSVLGHLENYQLEVVNRHNDNIRNIEGVFTLREYIEEKHVAGTVRLFLLATSFDRSEDINFLEADHANFSASIDLTEPPSDQATYLLMSQVPSATGVTQDTIVSLSGQVNQETVMIMPQLLTSPASVQLIDGQASPGLSAGPESPELQASPGLSTRQASPGPSTRQASFGLSAGQESSGLSADQESSQDTMSYDVHLKTVIQDTLMEIAHCQEPVKILRVFRKKLLRGRPFNPSSTAIPIHGETASIFVNRDSIFADAVDELQREDIDLSCPLEVQFIGEMSSDYGGPRREFLHNVYKEMMGQLFMETSGGFVIADDITLYVHERRYYVAGLIIALALLQEGPAPTSFQDEQLQAILHHPLTDAEHQIHEGLAYFGLPEIMKQKPCMIFLLRFRTVGRMSYATVVRDLKPVFAEVGTHEHRSQQKVYRQFLKYLKEAHAGRRGPITLERILQFATGASDEPTLGWDITPSIVFKRVAVATSNTCINRVTLPVADKSDEEYFENLDLAFINEYFGKL